MSDRTCSIEGCDAPHRARGWCKRHYNRWERTGNPLAVSSGQGSRARDPWSFVEKSDDGCWLWTGRRNEKGYGRYQAPDRTVHFAHRWAYASAVGPIPDGMELDHLCRNRACVNPDHLEPVTRQENLARSRNPARFAILHNTCARGHELTESNVYRHASSPTSRRCRKCIVIRSQLRKSKKAQAVVTD